MHREEVEEDRVPGLQLVAADVEGRTVRLDVGELGQRTLREPPRLAGHEGAGHEPGPQVRARDHLQAAFDGNRVDRDPGAGPAAVDVVVGLVLVPGRALPGATLLDEDVVVVEPDMGGVHQGCGHLGRAGVSRKALDLGDLGPAAEVLGEPSGIVRRAGDLGQ